MRKCILGKKKKKKKKKSKHSQLSHSTYSTRSVHPKLRTFGPPSPPAVRFTIVVWTGWMGRNSSSSSSSSSHQLCKTLNFTTLADPLLPHTTGGHFCHLAPHHHRFAPQPPVRSWRPRVDAFWTAAGGWSKLSHMSFRVCVVGFYLFTNFG